MRLRVRQRRTDCGLAGEALLVKMSTVIKIRFCIVSCSILCICLKKHIASSKSSQSASRQKSADSYKQRGNDPKYVNPRLLNLALSQPPVERWPALSCLQLMTTFVRRVALHDVVTALHHKPIERFQFASWCARRFI